MEGSIDSYGLKAQYQFLVDDKSIASMGTVINHLQEIERTVKQTAAAIKGSGLGNSLSQATAQMHSAMGQLSKDTSHISKQLSPLKAEFKALRAEARNIDFGDIGDDKAFKSATKSVKKYITSLKKLESQIEGTSAQEREFVATLKTQQRVATDKTTLAINQRIAADSADKIGKSQALKQTGQAVFAALANPMASANELQKSMGGIQKLADDLKDVNKLQNSIMSLSAKMAVNDTTVSAVFEDLASAGKSFKPGELEKRISEAEQILKNANALDVTVDTSTDLETTLGAKYKKLSASLAGGNVELAARTGSAINELADKLQDVKISAQDIIPYIKVVMNTVGEADNFKIPDIAAYAAALSSTGTIEAEVAGSFLNRLSGKIAESPKSFAKALGMGMEEFSYQLNTDKLGVITKIAEAYNNVEGGELKKGAFLGDIGIKTAQDQKLLQALATSLDVINKGREVGLAGFNGKAGESLSVERELNNVMKTSAFQAEKFRQSIKTLTDTFGLAIIEATLPFVKGLNAIIDVTLQLTQQFPLLTKIVGVSVYAFAALAAAAGTAGVVFFTFRQAAASATIASIAMRGAILPLTGFYETALTAYTASNPLSGSLTLLRSGFTGLVAPLNSATAAMQLAGRASLSFLVSPLGIAVASLGGLYLILEMATPGVSLLGTAIGALGAPIAFVSGILIGFTKGILSAFFAFGGGAAQRFATPFILLGDAIKTAVQILANFEGQGEAIGQNLAAAIVTPFKNAIALIEGLWSSTLGRIKGMLQPFADFAALIGMLLVHNLAENSPGPTSLIRWLWEKTGDFVKGVLLGIVPVAVAIGTKLGSIFNLVTTKIIPAFGASAILVSQAWKVAGSVIGGVWSGLVSTAQNVGGFLVQILNHGAADIVAMAWSNSVASISSSWNSLLSTAINIGGAIASPFVAAANQIATVVSNFTYKAPQPGAAYFVGPVPPSDFGKVSFQVQLLNQAIILVTKGIPTAIKAIGFYVNFVSTSIQAATTNLDTFGLALLALASLPMTLLKNLKPLTEIQAALGTIAPEVLGFVTFISTGVPRALALGLPGSVALGIAAGWNKGLERWARQTLTTTPGIIQNAIAGIFDSISPSTKDYLKLNLNIDLDASRAQIDDFVNSFTNTLGSILNYFVAIGDAAGDLGKRIIDNLRPILELKFDIFGIFTFRPVAQFLIVTPFFTAITELATSNAVRQGLQTIGTFLNTILVTVQGLFKAVKALGLSFGQTILTFLRSTSQFQKAEATIEEVVQTTKESFGATKDSAVDTGKAIYEVSKSIKQELISSLKEIPIVGDFLANTVEIFAARLKSLLNFSKAFIPLFVNALENNFSNVFTEEFISTFKSSFLGLFSEIGAGIAYAFKSNFGAAKNLLGLLFKIFPLYTKTFGFKGVVKGITPLDIIANKLMPEQKILQMKLTEILNAKVGMKGMDAALESVGMLGKLRIGLLYISPLIEMFASFTIGVFALRAALEPLNAEWFKGTEAIKQSIAQMGQYGSIFATVFDVIVKSIWVLKYATIAYTEILIFALKAIIPTAKAIEFIFSNLGEILGGVSKILAVVILGIATVVKTLVAAPLLAIPIEVLGIVDVLLYGFKASLGVIRAISTAVGDLLVYKFNEYGAALGGLFTKGDWKTIGSLLAHDLIINPFNWAFGWMIENAIAAFKTIVTQTLKFGLALGYAITHPIATLQSLGKAITSQLNKIAYAIDNTFSKVTGYIKKVIPPQVLNILTDIHTIQLLLAATMSVIFNKGAKAATGISIAEAAVASAGDAIIGTSSATATSIAATIATIAGFGAFLASGFGIVEYIRHFQELDATVDWTGQRIVEVQDLIGQMFAVITKPIAPGFADVLAGFIKGFVKSIPAILLFAVVLASVWKKGNIVAGVSAVLQGIGAIVFKLIQAVKLALSFGRAVKETAGSFETQTKLLGAAYNVRSRFQGKGPLGYESDEIAQLRGRQLEKSQAVVKYRKKVQKLYEQNQRQEEKQIISMSKSDSAASRNSVAGMTEIVEKKGIFGTRQVTQLTEKGRVHVEKLGNERIKNTSMGPFKDEVLAQIAQKTGVLDAYKKAGQPASAGHLRNLGLGDKLEMQRITEEFDKAVLGKQEVNTMIVGNLSLSSQATSTIARMASPSDYVLSSPDIAGIKSSAKGNNSIATATLINMMAEVEEKFQQLQLSSFDNEELLMIAKSTGAKGLPASVEYPNAGARNIGDLNDQTQELLSYKVLAQLGKVTPNQALTSAVTPNQIAEVINKDIVGDPGSFYFNTPGLETLFQNPALESAAIDSQKYIKQISEAAEKAQGRGEIDTVISKVVQQLMEEQLQQIRKSVELPALTSETEAVAEALTASGQKIRIGFKEVIGGAVTDFFLNFGKNIAEMQTAATNLKPVRDALNKRAAAKEARVVQTRMDKISQIRSTSGVKGDYDLVQQTGMIPDIKNAFLTQVATGSRDVILPGTKTPAKLTRDMSVGSGKKVEDIVRIFATSSTSEVVNQLPPDIVQKLTKYVQRKGMTLEALVAEMKGTKEAINKRMREIIEEGMNDDPTKVKKRLDNKKQATLYKMFSNGNLSIAQTQANLDQDTFLAIQNYAAKKKQTVEDVLVLLKYGENIYRTVEDVLSGADIISLPHSKYASLFKEYSQQILNFKNAQSKTAFDQNIQNLLKAKFQDSEVDLNDFIDKLLDKNSETEIFAELMTQGLIPETKDLASLEKTFDVKLASVSQGLLNTPKMQALLEAARGNLGGEAIQSALEKGIINQEDIYKTIKHIATLGNLDPDQLIDPSITSVQVRQARSKRSTMFDAKAASKPEFKRLRDSLEPMQLDSLLRGQLDELPKEIQTQIAQLFGYSGKQAIDKFSESLRTSNLIKGQGQPLSSKLKNIALSPLTGLASITGFSAIEENARYRNELINIQNETIVAEQKAMRQENQQLSVARAARAAGLEIALVEAKRSRKEVDQMLGSLKPVLDEFLATGELTKKATTQQKQQLANTLNVVGDSGLEDLRKYLLEFEVERVKRGRNNEVLTGSQGEVLREKVKVNLADTLTRLVGGKSLEDDELKTLVLGLKKVGINNEQNLNSFVEQLKQTPGADQLLIHFLKTGSFVQQLSEEEKKTITEALGLQSFQEVERLADRKLPLLIQFRLKVTNFVQSLVGAFVNFNQGITRAIETLRFIPFIGDPLADALLAIQKKITDSLVGAAKGIKSQFSNIIQAPAKVLAAIPGVRQFVAARTAYKEDRSQSLQGILKDAGYSKIEDFRAEFKASLAKRGLGNEEIQDKALNAFLKPGKGGIRQTISEDSILQRNRKAIEEAFAESVSLTTSQVSQLAKSGTYTTKAVAPFQIYLLKVLPSAMLDVGKALGISLFKVLPGSIAFLSRAVITTFGADALVANIKAYFNFAREAINLDAVLPNFKKRIDIAYNNFFFAVTSNIANTINKVRLAGFMPGLLAGLNKAFYAMSDKFAQASTEAKKELARSSKFNPLFLTGPIKRINAVFSYIATELTKSADDSQSVPVISNVFRLLSQAVTETQAKIQNAVTNAKNSAIAKIFASIFGIFQGIWEGIGSLFGKVFTPKIKKSVVTPPDAVRDETAIQKEINQNRKQRNGKKGNRVISSVSGMDEAIFLDQEHTRLTQELDNYRAAAKVPKPGEAGFIGPILPPKPEKTILPPSVNFGMGSPYIQRPTSRMLPPQPDEINPPVISSQDIEQTKKTLGQRIGNLFYEIAKAIKVPERKPQIVETPGYIKKPPTPPIPSQSSTTFGTGSPYLQRPTSRMLPPMDSAPPVATPQQENPPVFSWIPKEVIPIQQKISTSLIQAFKGTAQEIGDIFSGSATRTGAAWTRAVTKIKGVNFRELIRAAIRTGKSLVDRLNHGAADVTAEAWNRTQGIVDADMQSMGATAQVTGQQIGNSMTQAAVKPIGLFGKLGAAIGKVGHAGFAIGAAVTAAGFAAQQVASSLATMGLIDEETSQKLAKFTEIFTLVGALGGLATPIISALVSSLGAVVAVAGTVTTAFVDIGGAIFTFLISPVGLAVAGITAAIFLANAAIKKFFGVDLLAGAFTAIMAGISSGFAALKAYIPQASKSLINAIAPMSAALAPVMGTILTGLQAIFLEPFAPILAQLQPITNIISGAFTGAIAKVQSAWQFFIDNFGGKLFPIVKPALDVAQKLINALNHNPTERIPEAWEGAVDNIKELLSNLVKFAVGIGVSLIAAMGVKKLSAAISTHASAPTQNNVQGFTDKLQKFSLYANFANDVAQISGVQLPNFVQPLLQITTFVSILGDLSTTIIPALTGAFGGVGAAITGAFSTAATAVGGIFPLIGLIILAVGTLALVWKTNLFDIQGKTQVFAGWLGNAFVNAFIAIKEGWQSLSSNFLPTIQTAINGIPNAFIGAITQIESAWQSFVDNFGIRLQPVIQPALDIAQSLINALNHNPTEVIPQAWEGAVSRITESISSLPIIGKFVGNKLNEVLGAKIDSQQYGPQLPQVKKFTAKEYGPQLPQQSKPWWSPVSEFFGGAPAKAEPAPALVTDPGVLLDFSKQLAQAIALATGAGDTKAVANLNAIASENAGQITANKYAQMIVPGSGISTGGKYLQSAVTLANKRKERESYGGLINNVTSTGVNALQGKESWGDLQGAASALGSKSMENITNSEVGIQAQVLTANAQKSFQSLTLEMQDRWNFLQEEGFGNIGMLFEPGIEQAKAGFSNLGSDVSDFAAAATTAIMHLDFPALQKAAVDFGTNAMAALKLIGDGFGSAGLSAVVFGVYSLFALSPVGVTLTAIALAGLAVATNFLGLRNIIFGLVKITGGLINVLVATTRAIIGVAQGIGIIINGIKMLDLDTIKIGFQATFSAITQYANQLWQAIVQILGGIRQTFQGLFEGITQLFRGLLGAFLAPFSGVRSAIGMVVGAIRNLGTTLTNAIANPQRVWSAFLQLLERIRAKVAGVGEAISSSAVGRAVRAVKARATGQAGSMAAAREQVDFEERLKGKEPGLTVGDRVTAAKGKARNFFGGLFKGKNNPPSEAAPVTAASEPTTTQINALPSNRRVPVLAGQRQRQLPPASAPERLTNQRESISNVSNALGSLGSTLSFFAPAMSGPLFAVSALTDSFLSLGLVVPQLKAGFKSLFPALSNYISTTLAAGGATGFFNTSLNWLKISSMGVWNAIASTITSLYTYITTTYAAGGATGLFNASLNWLKASSMGAWIASTVTSLYTYITTTYAAGGATGLFNASLNWLKASSMGAWIASTVTGLYTYITTTYAAGGATGLFNASLNWLKASSMGAWIASTVTSLYTYITTTYAAGGATGLFNASLNWLKASSMGAWIASTVTGLYTYITTTYAAGGATGLFNASLNWLKASSMGAWIASTVTGLYTYITTTYAAGGATGLFNASLNWLKASSMGAWIASTVTSLYTYITTTYAAGGATGLFNASLNWLKASSMGAWIASTVTGLITYISTALAAGGVTGLLGTAFTWLGTAATVAWVAITGPLLPFIVAIGAVIAVLGLAYLAFKNNFLGIGSLIGGIVDGFTEFFGTLFGGIWDAVAGVFGTVGEELGSIWNLIVSIGQALLIPFQPLFDLFGGSGGKGGMLGDVGKILANVILFPIRLIAGFITLIVRGISLVIKILAVLGGVVLGVALIPFMLLVATIKGAFTVLGWLGSLIFNIGKNVLTVLVWPFQQLWNLIVALGEVVAKALLSPFQAVAGILEKVTGFFAGIPIIGKLFAGGSPQTEVQQFASGGLVRGPGTSTGDKVPAMVSPGEYVVNAAATRQNFAALESMNTGARVMPEVMPTPVPTIVQAPMVKSTPSAEMPPMEFNFTFGDIILQGATGAEAATELLDNLEPQLERKVQQIIRRLLEFKK